MAETLFKKHEVNQSAGGAPVAHLAEHVSHGQKAESLAASDSEPRPFPASSPLSLYPLPCQIFSCLSS